MNQSFRRERTRNNITQELQDEVNENNSSESDNKTTSFEGNRPPSAIKRFESVYHFIKDSMPETTHNIHIIHALRNYRDQMTERLLNENPYHKSTESYENNKISIRFLLKHLTTPDYKFYKEMNDLLHTMPLKYDDLDGQTSDINDVIRIIREDSGEQSPTIPYLTTNNEMFNNSQASVKHSAPGTVSSSKPQRSID